MAEGDGAGGGEDGHDGDFGVEFGKVSFGAVWKGGKLCREILQLEHTIAMRKDDRREPRVIVRRAVGDVNVQ